jgi:anti-sigma regulatory factor (Ser/Thr protein kinase)
MTVKTVARPRGHSGYSESLPCTADSTKIARRLVSSALWAWGLDGLVDDSALVVTELVTNAAQHTKSRLIRVTITRLAPGTVRIEVVDRSRALPQPRDPQTDDERGRGLLLVRNLTERCGADRLAFGKRVWGELVCGVAG